MPKINRNGRASILTGSDFSKLSKQLNSDRDHLLFNILRYTGERIAEDVEQEAIAVRVELSAKLGEIGSS